MSADKLYINSASWKKNSRNEPKLIAADIENVPFISNKIDGINYGPYIG